MGRKKKERLGIVSESDGTLDMAQVEMEYIDIINYRRKQKNNLLGVFVDDEYKIPEEIKKELIKIPKKFDRFEENFMFAAIKVGNFVLNFRIEMNIQPDFCKAKLFLVEIEQTIEEDIKHLTLLDEVLEVYSPKFRENFEKRWNIIFEGEQVQQDDFLEKYLAMQSEEYYFNRELVEILSQLYVMRMLAQLSNMGEIGDKVFFEYKFLMEKHMKSNPSFSLDYTLQKELLDYVLLKNNALNEVLKSEEGKKILQGFSTPLKNVRDKTYPSILTEAKTQKKKEEKTAKKPVAKKKPIAKKSASKSKPPKPKIYDIGKNYKPMFSEGLSFGGGGGAKKKASEPTKSALDGYTSKPHKNMSRNAPVGKTPNPVDSRNGKTSAVDPEKEAELLNALVNNPEIPEKIKTETIDDGRSIPIEQNKNVEELVANPTEEPSLNKSPEPSRVNLERVKS